MIELALRLAGQEFFILVPEMRPQTLWAVLERAGWNFDARRGAWVKGNAELREVHTLEHDDHFDAILTGPKSWRLVEALLVALGGDTK